MRMFYTANGNFSKVLELWKSEIINRLQYNKLSKDKKCFIAFAFS